MGGYDFTHYKKSTETSKSLAKHCTKNMPDKLSWCILGAKTGWLKQWAFISHSSGDWDQGAERFSIW